MLHKIRKCAAAAMMDGEAVADRLTGNCEAELKEKAAEARKRLDDEARLAVDAREWVESIQEYRDIAEIDAATRHRAEFYT